jgi:hypothetical protein
MAKITLTDLANLDNPQIAVSVINTNMARIEAAIENTFSLDGTDPNSLTGELDANGQRIINLPAPVDYTEPARHGQLQQYVDEAEAAQVASEAAQVITEAARDDAVIAKDDAEAAAVEAVAAAINITNYDLLFYSGGAMEDNETLFRLVATRGFQLPASLTGSEFSAGSAATGSTTVTLYKNAGSIGTLVWGVAATEPTVTFASAVTFAAGDIFRISGPATADATLGDVAMSFIALRV